MQEIMISERMPVLALRGLTIFPKATMHFDVGREKSVRALDKAMANDQRIFLVTQKDLLEDDPDFDGLYPVGTIAHVRQVLKMPGDSVRILVYGETRARVTQVHQTAPYLCARVESLNDLEFTNHTPRVHALMRQATQMFDEFAELSQRPVQDAMLKILSSRDPGFIADIVTQSASFDFADKVRILSELHPVHRLQKTNRLMAHELEVLRLENEIQDMTQQNIDKGQRDYYLREQMKVIRGELGENDDEAEVDEYYAKIRKLSLSEEISEKLKKEVQRLAKQPFGSSESSVIRNYLDVALALPWNVKTKERLKELSVRAKESMGEDTGEIFDIHILLSLNIFDLSVFKPLVKRVYILSMRKINKY